MSIHTYFHLDALVENWVVTQFEIFDSDVLPFPISDFELRILNFYSSFK
jgi:hypothetical protein